MLARLLLPHIYACKKLLIQQRNVRSRTVAVLLPRAEHSECTQGKRMMHTLITEGRSKVALAPSLPLPHPLYNPHPSWLAPSPPNLLYSSSSISSILHPFLCFLHFSCFLDRKASQTAKTSTDFPPRRRVCRKKGPPQQW